MKLCVDSIAVVLSAAVAQDGAVWCRMGFCPCVHGKTASPAGDAGFCGGSSGQGAPRVRPGAGPGVTA